MRPQFLALATLLALTAATFSAAGSPTSQKSRSKSDVEGTSSTSATRRSSHAAARDSAAGKSKVSEKPATRKSAASGSASSKQVTTAKSHQPSPKSKRATVATSKSKQDEQDDDAPTKPKAKAGAKIARDLSPEPEPKRSRSTSRALAPLSTTAARKHPLTPAEKRLAHIRQINLEARARRELQTESNDRSAELETQPLRRYDYLDMPAPLKGSHESLLRQNTRNNESGLDRIEDDDDLNQRIADGLLVKVPTNSALAINGDLPENRRYCRPWTSSFLTDLSRAHASEFQNALIVTSAVRTVEYQRKLIGVNGNAAPAEGDVASPHLTGGSIDIAKSSMTKREIAWMRRYLLTLQNAGQIDVEEEFKQACFHITVYDSYEAQTVPAPAPKAKARRSKPARNSTAENATASSVPTGE